MTRLRGATAEIENLPDTRLQAFKRIGNVEESAKFEYLSQLLSVFPVGVHLSHSPSMHLWTAKAQLDDMDVIVAIGPTLEETLERLLPMLQTYVSHIPMIE